MRPHSLAEIRAALRIEAEQASTESLPESADLAAIDRLIDTARRTEPNVAYTWFSPRFMRGVEDHGAQLQYDDSRMLYKALLLRALSARLDERLAGETGAEQEMYFLRNAKRILVQAVTNDYDYYHLGQDRYIKDFGIALGRLDPVGSFLLERNSGIPRSIGVKRGIPQFANFTRCVLRTKGFKPFFQSHLNMQDLAFFNEQGSIACYAVVAKMLERSPAQRGLMRSNWFVDPALEALSPHLQHFADLPLANGAYRFFVKWDDDGQSGALNRSKTRQRAHAAGQYRPAYYMIVWPRKAMCDWLSRNRGALPAVHPDIVTEVQTS